jgi:hypothetical protein
VLFNDNTLARDWRERVFDCRDQGLSIDRATAFAVAVADLLQLPDDMPLMPAVTAAMSIPTRLSDRASLAHPRAVAHAAGRGALSDADKACCGPQSEASRGSRIMATHSGGRRDRDPEASSYAEGRLGGL